MNVRASHQFRAIIAQTDSPPHMNAAALTNTYHEAQALQTRLSALANSIDRTTPNLKTVVPIDKAWVELRAASNSLKIAATNLELALARLQ